MAGDPYPLGPLGGKTFWPKKRERELSVKELLGRDYYMDCDAFFELSIGQQNFGLFYSFLSRLRLGKSAQEDINMINQRVTYSQGRVT